MSPALIPCSRKLSGFLLLLAIGLIHGPTAAHGPGHGGYARPLPQSPLVGLPPTYIPPGSVPPTYIAPGTPPPWANPGTSPPWAAQVAPTMPFIPSDPALNQRNLLEEELRLRGWRPEVSPGLSDRRHDGRDSHGEMRPRERNFEDGNRRRGFDHR